MEKRIALGSGKIYLKNTTEITDLSFDDPEALIKDFCIPENEFGAVKNGATIAYSPTNYTASDDLGRFTKTITQEETVTLGCGLITVGLKMLEVLADSGRVISNSGKKSFIKIGGTENSKNASYLIIFEHLDAKDGNIYVILIGKNTAELSIAFAPGAETVLNPTFTAEGMDDEGTKLIILMDDPAAVSGGDGA